MMSMILYLFFMIPLLVCEFSWWLVVFFLMVGFFFFFGNFWFMGFYSMLSYSLGGDILSMSMIFLSFWIILLMVLASSLIYNLSGYFTEFLFLNLILLIFLILVFSSTNLFMFYVFFESSLIPTLFLIFGWGYQPERLSAGYYLLFYTFFGSMPLLLSIFYLGESSLFYFLICFDYSIYLFMGLVVAFLISVPMIFFHFWLPRAHVEAPVSGSMVLAGVLLSMGGYGLLRVMYFVGPIPYYYLLVGLSLFGSVMVGFMCLYQVDIKSLIAYSSVSHMGLVICGIFTLNGWGFAGSLVLMIGHGLCSSCLFCFANMIYERTNSRSLILNSGLISLSPSFCFMWFVASANNMSSPPSLNLVGEVLLISSIMSWSSLSWLFLGFVSFFSCCYSIYMYSCVVHGCVGNTIMGFNSFTVRELVLGIFHLLPLNFIILKLDIFSLWI